MSRFLEALHSGRVLLMDGAMGTELLRAGPESVRAVHQAYIDAGAEVMLTNTFAARSAIDASLLEAALALAREAAGKERFVLLDVGPLGLENRRNGAACLLDVGVRNSADALLVETASDIADVARVLKHRVRSGFKRSTLPVLFSWTYRRNRLGALCTVGGWLPERCAETACRFDIAALGVNCGRDIDMDDIIEIIGRYRTVTDLPLFARPNAGTPAKQGEQWIYPHTPEAMAARLPVLLEAGACMVGGCCGTTPAHIAAFRTVVDTWNQRRW